MSTRLIAMSQSLGIEFTTSELTEKKKKQGFLIIY